MNKDLAKTIGSAARQARKALQLTQEDIAEKIGVSVEFYARIERGTSLPSILTFARIVSALGISADLMLGHHHRIVPVVGAGWMPQTPDDSPEVRRIVRRLRKAQPSTLRLVNMLLKALKSTEEEADKQSSTEDGSRSSDTAVETVAEDTTTETSSNETAADESDEVATAPAAEATEATEAPAEFTSSDQLVAASKALEREAGPAGMRPLSKPRRVFTYGSTASAVAE